MHSKVKSIIDAWHIFKSSYDETSNFLIFSSYELLIICQASIVDETQYAKKFILKTLGENYKNIKLRKIWGNSSGQPAKDRDRGVFMKFTRYPIIIQNGNSVTETKNYRKIEEALYNRGNVSSITNVMNTFEDNRRLNFPHLLSVVIATYTIHSFGQRALIITEKFSDLLPKRERFTLLHFIGQTFRSQTLFVTHTLPQFMFKSGARNQQCVRYRATSWRTCTPPIKERCT